MRGSGIGPPIAEVFPSPIHAKFSDPGKPRKALWETAFSAKIMKIHPHDLEKSLFYFSRTELLSQLVKSALNLWLETHSHTLRITD
jgi:hypothetical protein